MTDQAWCNCDSGADTCPVHCAEGADLWHICDVCCRAPHERAAVLRPILEGASTELASGVMVYDAPGVDAVTHFTDGWQLLEHERGETLLCPEHRLSLSKALPAVFGGKR